MTLPELLALIWGGIIPGSVVVLLALNLAANNVVETYQTARQYPHSRMAKR